MPLEGDAHFKDLKKSCAGGSELSGKTIGIIGFGRIGQEVAKIAIGIGMKVLFSDKLFEEQEINIQFFDNQKVNFKLTPSKIDFLLKNSDFITLHVPATDKYLINKKEINLMKNGSGILNLARGGVVNEEELLIALDSKKLAFAAIDTFENEPKPRIKILMNSKISLSPHIGAATLEAQDRIGIELAEKIIEILK
jgi:D-3-phosphoglycerate dehydrogenase